MAHDALKAGDRNGLAAGVEPVLEVRRLDIGRHIGADLLLVAGALRANGARAGLPGRKERERCSGGGEEEANPVHLRSMLRLTPQCRSGMAK